MNEINFWLIASIVVLFFVFVLYLKQLILYVFVKYFIMLTKSAAEIKKIIILIIIISDAVLEIHLFKT